MKRKRDSIDEHGSNERSTKRRKLTLRIRMMALSSLDKAQLDKYHLETYYEGDELLKIIPIHRQKVHEKRVVLQSKVLYNSPFFVEDGVLNKKTGNTNISGSNDIDYYPNIFGSPGTPDIDNISMPTPQPYWIPEHNQFFGKDIASIKKSTKKSPFYPFKITDIRVRDLPKAYSLVSDIVKNIDTLNDYVLHESEKREFVVNEFQDKKKAFLKKLRADCKIEYSIKIKRILIKE